MNTFKKFLSFSIIALFFTNLWIAVYLNLLPILNYIFPPVVPVKFYRPAVAFPEKFEMSLYLILTFVFTLIIWTILKTQIDLLSAFKIKNDTHKILVKIAALLFLILIFISKIGIYPLSNEIYPYQLRPDQTIYYISIAVYILALGLIIFESAINSRLINKSRLLSQFYYLFIILLISSLIFEPRFPSSPLEYAFFFGPIWEIIKGKTIFTDIPSQYGFLSILLFSLLFKFKLFAFSHLAVWNFIFHLVQYFICYYLVYKISKSVTLGLIALFSIITLNYFSFYIPILTVAQYGALRRLPFFIILFLAYKRKKMDSLPFIFIFSILSFWIVDSGIQMILAYGLTLFYLFLAGCLNFKRLIRAGILLLINLAGIFIFINLLHLVAGWKMINAIEIIGTLRQYAISGVGMLPIENQTYFWIAILIYFASIIYFFKTTSKEAASESDSGGEFGRDSVSAQDSSSNYHKAYQEEQYSEIDSGKSKDRSEHLREGRVRQNLNQIILLSANLMLFASLYYVGRSDNASLIVISIFPLLNLFLLLGIFYRNLTESKFRILFNVALFIIFIVIPTYQRKVTLTELLLKKYEAYKTGNIFRNDFEDNLNNRFSDEKDLVLKYLPEKESLILSSDDTYLLYLTDKKTLLDENPQSGIESDFEMNLALKNTLKKCPKKIAVDCSMVGKCPSFTPFTKGWLTAGYIYTEIESTCKFKYQPVTCTSELCIVEAN